MLDLIYETELSNEQLSDRSEVGAKSEHFLLAKGNQWTYSTAPALVLKSGEEIEAIKS